MGHVALDTCAGPAYDRRPAGPTGGELMRGSTLKAAVAGGVAGALVAAATAAVAGTGVGGVFNLGKANSVNGFATGTNANSRAGVFGQGGGAIPGGWFTSGSGPAGKFSSYSGAGLIAIGPGDNGHQDTGGNGVDAGTTASGQAAVWAHFDS